MVRNLWTDRSNCTDFNIKNNSWPGPRLKSVRLCHRWPLFHRDWETLLFKKTNRLTNSDFNFEHGRNVPAKGFSVRTIKGWLVVQKDNFDCSLSTWRPQPYTATVAWTPSYHERPRPTQNSFLVLWVFKGFGYSETGWEVMV